MKALNKISFRKAVVFSRISGELKFLKPSDLCAEFTFDPIHPSTGFEVKSRTNCLKTVKF